LGKGAVVRMIRCDHCGKEGIPEDDNEFVIGWEDITVSGDGDYDICDKCAPALLEFLKPQKERPDKGPSPTGGGVANK
jgi:hypothetical protein